jgi:hypothetical protein
MSMMFPYQRGSQPLINWSNGVPRQSRAAEAVSLGSLGDPTLVLPAPGAPEVLSTTPARGPYSSMGGCSCSGSCGCGGHAMGDDQVGGIGSLAMGIGVGIAALWLIHHLNK